VCLTLSLLACSAPDNATPAQPVTEAHPAAEPASDDRLTLTADEIAHLGVRTLALTSISRAAEIAGYALVLPRDTLAAAIAERSVAQAAQNQSSAALSRQRALADTPGALSSEMQQTVERQAATDTAALELARSRLSALLGDHPDWGVDESTVLQRLERGELKLARATFPLGALSGSLPATLRLSPLSAVRSRGPWQSKRFWRAPADPAIAGNSLYALVQAPNMTEGEHLLAWAPGSRTETGVMVPMAAIVIHEAHYWCYVARTATTFERVELSAEAASAAGYFMTSGVHAGDRVVIAAAGLLLARQSGPADESD